MAYWITIVSSFQTFDKILEYSKLIQFWVIDISTAVYVQNQNRWWEIFKFQIMPIKNARMSPIEGLKPLVETYSRIICR